MDHYQAASAARHHYYAELSSEGGETHIQCIAPGDAFYGDYPLTTGLHYMTWLGRDHKGMFRGLDLRKISQTVELRQYSA